MKLQIAARFGAGAIVLALALALALFTGLAYAPAAGAALTFDVDYSLDSNNFFNPSTGNGLAARAVMTRAGQMLGDRIVDGVLPIAPQSGDTWTTDFTHPGTGVAKHAINNLNIPANTVKVYVGARNLGGALGLGGPGGYTGSGSQSFLNALQFRGQVGAQGLSPTDFGPWGGSISFDSAPSTAWNFNLSGPQAGRNDFYTIALHELAHVLGFGTSGSWNTFRSGTQFTGPKAKALNGGGNVPLYDLEDPTAHYQVGTRSTVGGVGPLQEAAMSPSVVVGTRKKFTLIDFAGLDDIGWDLARPGDANADGAVDFADLVALAQNYNASDPLMRWAQGDFDYNGTVAFADLVALAQNYGTSGVLGAPSPADVSAQFGEAFARDFAAAQAIAAVPEPAWMSLLGLLGTCLLGRSRGEPSRRRRPPPRAH